MTLSWIAGASCVKYPEKEMGALLQKAFDAQLDGVFSNREGAEQWLCDQLSPQ